MDDDLVVVYVSQGPLAAEVAKSKLESYGLTVALRYSPVGRVLGLTVDGLGRVEVLVAPQDEARARELLEEAQEPEATDDDAPDPGAAEEGED